MSTIIRCDRCGKIIPKNERVFKLLGNGKSYDFCQECADDWAEFMDVKKYKFTEGYEIKED